MRTPSSQERVMNNSDVTTEIEQPLKEVTNLPSQQDTSNANGSTSGTRTTAETQRLILEELQKANSRLDQFGTDISSLETTFLIRKFPKLAADTQ